MDAEKAQSTIKSKLTAIITNKPDVKSNLDVMRASVESLKTNSQLALTKEGFTPEFIEAEGENRPLFISEFPTDDEGRFVGQFFDFYFSMDTNSWVKFDLQDAVSTC